MKIVHLTKGYDAIVDNVDYERVIKFKWYASVQVSGIVYAYRTCKKKTIIMHRFIVNAPMDTSIGVDHINGDGLDNRKSNLRLCTKSQNAANSRKYATNTSGYKGVYFDKRENKWVSRIRLSGKRIYIGGFNDRISAAKSYDLKAKEIFGRFAKLNFKEAN